MTPAGFEHAIPASERLYAYVLDRAATGFGIRIPTRHKMHADCAFIVNNYDDP
jgi:hypothetical protein